ncbi:hypothetical protein BK767_14570 [Bacillus thuringiensis serovar kyushuensis]|nr:hypothetical protein BK767_14570 [Bacillus thuringiensis serovar kyushuensis]OTZ72176.1 hypothetical protein BK768_19260 [Bacillus thuringiensis serovar tohokuensis]
MPINLRFCTILSVKTLFSLKRKLEKVTFLIHLSIQDRLQLFSGELCRYLVPSLLKELSKN